MRQPLLLAAAAAGLAASAHAQVDRYVGQSPNVTTAIDFDNPFVASQNPFDPAALTGTGIQSIAVVGTGWQATGDVMSATASVMGQGLVVQNGTLAVAGVGEPLDNPDAGDGWDIVLDSPADEFQVQFVDQSNFNYTVELFSGATSLGTGSWDYPAPHPTPPHYWRSSSGPFDRIVITMTGGTGGVGIDELGIGNGPAPQPPANDDCAGAAAVMVGAPATFDTTLATTSALAFGCAQAGQDVWFEYTSTSSMDLRFDTCGSGFDTVLEVFSGDCGNLAPVACNDDACGTQSLATVSGVTAGATYLVRVGGFGGEFGVGSLSVTEVPPAPVPPTIGTNCVETLFATDLGGDVGGAVYFDLTTTQNVSLEGLFTNTGVNGLPVGIEMWVIPGTYVGNNGSQAGWMLAATDAGNAIGQGSDSMTYIQFAAPAVLAAGSYGVALVGVNMDHDYTAGTGANQNYMAPDGILSIAAGAADNTPFSGGAFSPRVWNGVFCQGVALPGVNFCGPANANSTGAPAAMSASGSSIVADNDLTLEAEGLPLNSFAYFINSRIQSFVPNPGGSAGDLCLGGAIGRLNDTPQILNSGATGTVSLLLDLTMMPTPSGLVPVVAGDTWNFQCWYRDTDTATGAATSNFTDGRSFVFN